MNEETKPDRNGEDAVHQENHIAKTDLGGRILSTSALAAAAAALALPLIKVKSVQALTVYCAADGYAGQDIGDPGDCWDCFINMLPADCGVSGGDVPPGDNPTDNPYYGCA
jgi:hypothetical protein